MATNTRVRIEPDIEDYLKAQSERVLGKSVQSGADLTTITNRLLYEHKLAQAMARQVPFARLFNWVMGLVPGGSKIVSLSNNEPPALKESQPDSFDFDADFADQFEDAA